MENCGIAYGFVRSELSLLDLEHLLFEKGSATLSLNLVPLDYGTHFPSSNGEFEHEVKRAVRGSMNYAIEARLSDDSNYLTARRLALLFETALGDQDHGAIYWDGGKFHHSNDVREGDVSQNE